MKIAVYHPNINLFGGGERFALIIARILSTEHEVDLFTPHSINKKELGVFFKINIDKLVFIKFGKFIENLPILNSAKPSILLRSAYKKLEKYDLVIDSCTNGWFDKKLKCRTICYIHYPFFQPQKKGVKSLMNPLIIKLQNAFQYDKIFCNSNFTKNIVDKITDKPLEVLNPPVEVEKIKPLKKLNIIITVGRLTYEKKFEVMIEAFKEIYQKNKDYKFYIVGIFNEKSSFYKQDYLDMLRSMAKGYPIEFYINAPYDEVINHLEKSKIYWHARGYGETNPTEYENFGLTTVESMAAGCVPIVINLGAQPEIVQHEKNGYCWDTPEELTNYTKLLIFNKRKLDTLSKEAVKRSRIFSLKRFEKRIIEVINSLF